MKNCTLTFDLASKSWIHDGSGLRFFGWSEGPSRQEEFEKIRDLAKQRLAAFFTKTAGHHPVSPDEIVLVWGKAPMAQTPPLEMVVHNLIRETPYINADADPLASTAPLLRNAVSVKSPRT